MKSFISSYDSHAPIDWPKNNSVQRPNIQLNLVRPHYPEQQGKQATWTLQYHNKALFQLNSKNLDHDELIPQEQSKRATKWNHWSLYLRFTCASIDCPGATGVERSNIRLTLETPIIQNFQHTENISVFSNSVNWKPNYQTSNSWKISKYGRCFDSSNPLHSPLDNIRTANWLCNREKDPEILKDGKSYSVYGNYFIYLEKWNLENITGKIQYRNLPRWRDNLADMIMQTIWKTWPSGLARVVECCELQTGGHRIKSTSWLPQWILWASTSLPS